MELYLIQHGQAKSKDVDSERHLTEAGEQETQLMAEMAAKLGLDIAEIRHSGKTRAEQTATIFARALALLGDVTAASGLGPTDDVQPVGDALTEAGQPVMLVGHMPFMDRLAGYLVNGDPADSAVEFQNSGIVCLAHQDGDWQVRWRLTPG